MLRFLDIVLAGLGLLVALPLMAVLFLIGLFDTGAPLFRQERVGQHQKPFTLVKFRTMRPDTQLGRHPPGQPGSGDAIGCIFAPYQARRVAATVERAQGRDEFGGATALFVQSDGID